MGATSIRSQNIEASIFHLRLKSITKKMSLALYRATRSPLFNQGDFATGMMDPQGQMLEQDEHLPLMAFSLFPGCQYTIDFLGDEIYPDDLIIHNDVFCNNLQHADTGFYKPVFYHDQLVAWLGCRGHWADIGGAVKGTCNPDATEVWQEALRLPPVKVQERGRWRKDVWNMIFSNVRLREIVESDAKAQLGSIEIGERELLKLIDQIGLEAFRRNYVELMNITEQMMRQIITAIPDGVYKGESVVYDDSPRQTEERHVRLQVTIKSSDLEFDYTGTDPQNDTFVNASYVSAASGTLTILFQVLKAIDIPHNQGLLRPIKIHIPEGSLLNARFPAATFYGNKLVEHNAEAVMKALAQPLPENVTAGKARRLSYRMTGVDPRNGSGYHDIFFLTHEGGGASYGCDGYNQPGLLGGGPVLSQDYELFELQNPVYLIKHEYGTDSSGPGRWRGGLGNETIVRYYGEQTLAVLHGDGTIVGPHGLAGGKSGPVSHVEIHYPDGSVRNCHAREIAGYVPKDTLSFHYAAGGGGYGDPYQRPVEKVLEDVWNGFVSVARAREDYGVVIDPETMAVDTAATERLRAR
ncbi:MAG: hydantoinase B/oxoprolinase family protein [Chloroflexi bacterium]|nr:hydantoinase B/oxoprolinase family protein [Chloroflexota bacterium]